MNNRVKANMRVWAISYMLTALKVYTVISAITDQQFMSTKGYYH